MARVKRIDVHSHVAPKEMLDAMRRRPSDYGMRVENDRFYKDDGALFPVFAEFHDVDAKIEGMDRKGIDVSVLSPVPSTFFYWLDADIGLAAARTTNDGVAKMVAARPDRLRGMATLPMQDPDAAVAELERVVKAHGFRAIELACTIGDEQLAEPKFRPVLRRAAELGVFIFAHPHYMGPTRTAFECYYLANLIGHPLDTVTMAAHLMFSGTLDELPGLKVVLAHGGGYLPYQIGRLAHGHVVRSETKVRSKISPYDLLRRFYFDALTHDAVALRFLIDRVGADRVTLGTDAPYDMGEENPLDMLNALPGLSNEQRDRILGLNLLELMGERAG